jgi:hypothetical protein
MEYLQIECQVRDEVLDASYSRWAWELHARFSLPEPRPAAALSETEADHAKLTVAAFRTVLSTRTPAIDRQDDRPDRTEIVGSTPELIRSVRLLEESDAGSP